MTFIRTLIALGILILGIKGHGHLNNNSYSIVQFNKNVGLYFEKRELLQFTAGIWRTTIFLETMQSANFLSALSHNIMGVMDHCRYTGSQMQCGKILGLEKIKRKYDAANKTQIALLKAVEELTQYTQQYNPNESQTAFQRSKRSVPWFGFVGKIAGPVAGILNYDDGERYEKAIHELNLHENKISKLMGEQTHVVRSELHELHLQAFQQYNELETLKKQLTNLTNNLTEVELHLVRMEYNTLLEQIAFSAEFSIEEYQASLDKFIAVMQAAQEGKIHPALITIEQLIRICRDVQDILPELEFPIAPHQTNLIDLIRISKALLRIQNNKLIVALDIPLLRRNRYQLFKLHSVPIDQHVFNSTGRAYIVPRTKYLALDEDRRHYVFITEETLQGCQLLQGKQLCHSTEPVFDTVLVKACETELLRQPSIDTLRTCDIRISTNEQPLWISITTLGGWLFSLTQSEKAYLNCIGSTTKELQIQGTGLLQIEKGCTFSTDKVTLAALILQKDPQQYIYSSTINLNISELYPKILNFQQSLYQISDKKRTSQPSLIWTKDNADATLAELEKQWNLLSEQQIDCTRQQILTYSVFGGSFILVILLLICIFRNQIVSLVKKLPSCKKDQQTNNQQNINMHHYSTPIYNGILSPNTAEISRNEDKQTNSSIKTSMESTENEKTLKEDISSTKETPNTSNHVLPPQTLKVS